MKIKQNHLNKFKIKKYNICKAYIINEYYFKSYTKNIFINIVNQDIVIIIIMIRMESIF